MRKIHLLLLSLTLFFCQVNAQTSDALISRLGEEYIKSPEAIGLSIAVYHLDKANYYNFGTTEKGKDQPATAATVYEIGSITKTFVSTLLAFAVTEGKVKLDDDIRNYLPGDYLNLAYQGEAVKLVHLANLTSELPNWLPDKPEVFQGIASDSIPYVLLDLHKNYTQQDFYRDLKSVQLKSAPGKNIRHSNVAAQLLGFILEHVYQKPLELLVKQYITQPLGMNQTNFVISQTKPMAKGYDAKGNTMPYVTMKDSQGAGGLTSTAEDMIKYIRFQLNETNSAVMLSHQKTVEGPKNFVGLNWQLGNTDTGNRKIWHTGGTFGFSSYVVIYPESKLGIVVLANESDGMTQNKLVNIASQIGDSLTNATK
ncbi:beta-lactamase family protein [Dyadobacter sp. CY345]|uniref:serine hydrolase domain-containing protein n=1 Tax=Dyadobacter sp. CY345 TaxID=2909335 RepID=UPI001F3BEBE9|nr:serine hydrolase domain-containing protein [Dyadobacter sp. CY345]MCF2443975.1 beta-lactamase family protein [Dyadobacter sp. CY345]